MTGLNSECVVLFSALHCLTLCAVKILLFSTDEIRNVMKVMKLYEGSLGEQLDLAGRFPIAHSLDVFGQLCGAVAELHDAAVVNQDLKPGNVLYDRYGR